MAIELDPAPSSATASPSHDVPVTSSRRRWAIRLGLVALALLVLQVVAPEVLRVSTSSPGAALRIAALIALLVGWARVVRRVVASRIVAGTLTLVPAIGLAVWGLAPYLGDDVVDEGFPVLATDELPGADRAASFGDGGRSGADEGAPTARDDRSDTTGARVPTDGPSGGDDPARADDGPTGARSGAGDEVVLGRSPASESAPAVGGTAPGARSTADPVLADEPRATATPGDARDPGDEGASATPAADEAPAAESTAPTSPPAEEPTATTQAPAQPVALVTGDFQGLTGHRGSGRATVYELADGSRILRFEEFDISNGPDLEVHLVRGVDQRRPGANTKLADLTGNRGDQNYAFPAGFDIAEPFTVLIYCVPFDVEVANATLR